MLCPNPACAALNPPPTLVLSERNGIEIDYCPHCRGVWLDRGELDKLIERATVAVHPASASTERQARKEEKPWREEKPWKKAGQYSGYGHHPHHGKRKKSLLSEIFDF